MDEINSPADIGRIPN